MIRALFTGILLTAFGELTQLLSPRLSERCFAPAGFSTLHPSEGAASATRCGLASNCNSLRDLRRKRKNRQRRQRCEQNSQQL